MSCIKRFWAPALRQIVIAGIVALLTPMASWANSIAPNICDPGSVCITNDGGTLSGTTSGLSITGSTVTQIGNLQGADLGTFTLSTGSLLTGNLTTGGTFAAGGSITITEGSSTLFSGTFSSPVNWTETGVIVHVSHGHTTYTCGSGGCMYYLDASVTGTYSSSGLMVTGGTIQETLSSRTPFPIGGGSLQLANGSTSLFTPEPSTLGLMGTGFVGIGLVARRKLKAKTNNS